MEATQPLEAIAALGPCSWQGGAQDMALLQTGLFKVSAVPFLQVVLHMREGGVRQFYACVLDQNTALV